VDLSTNPITTDDQGRPLHFGNFKLGEVHGMKFEDKNGNGVLDQGEPGLEGWTIVLTGENHPPHRAITGPDGAYSFFDVFFDVYTLTEESQEGWTQRTSNPFPFTVQSSEVVTGQDFGNFKNVEIIAYKYEDVNADGVNGPEDPPVPGWAITLNGTDTRFTDDNGMVSWIVTTGGDYHIEEEVRPDWIPTAPTFFDVFVTSGDAPYIGEFLNYHYGIISGYKYEDMNNNGVRDADEPGLPGWTITLNPGNQLAFTDQDGYYSFGGLLPGLYTLSEVPQVGWYQSEPGHNIHAVNVTSGTNAERDFGNFRLGSIAGMKFEDVNGNGTHDPEEPGLPNWTIKVYQSTLEVASTVTDADGRYSFIDLIPGPYEVAEVMKPHWGQTLPGGDGILDIFVHSGEGVTDAYFGNFKLGIIEGVKYHDRNGNRAKDPGEPGLPGWRIVLHNLTTGAQAAMLTGPGGMYQFVDLMPGRYLVREQLKSRWIPSSPRNGLYNPVIVDTSGQVLTRDFGNRQVPRAR